MSFLGSYEFRAGQSAPAISIITPGRDLPAVKKVAGVEVIIHDAADVRRLDYVTASSDVIVDWKVFFICWEPSTGLELTAAVSRAMRHFSGSSSLETVAVADGLGAQVQTKLIVKGDMPIVAV